MIVPLKFLVNDANQVPSLSRKTRNELYQTRQILEEDFINSQAVRETWPEVSVKLMYHLYYNIVVL